VALDVYEEEEGVFFEDHSASALQDDVLSRLLTFPNVLITSHQAFLTHEALAAIAAVTLDSIQRHCAAQAPVDERVVV
jgi:D-lactate dehydrogenase